MRRVILTVLTVVVLVLSACASTPTESESAAPPLAAGDETPTTDPVETDSASPTPVDIPTTTPDTTPETPAATTTPAPQPTSATAQPAPTPTSGSTTSTPVPTSQPTATSVPAPTAQPTPAPTSTASPAPTAQPTSPPASAAYIDPDCYVGTGAADEPVWWCDGRICVQNQLHYGCPPTPPDIAVNPICTSPRPGAAAQAVVPCDRPICVINGRYFVCDQPTRPPLNLSCSISDTSIVVNEIITITAIQNPVRVAVEVAISHGDGTIDHTWESRAYYRSPGSYPVKLLYSYYGGKGTIDCGTVTVRAGHTPTPTPTPPAVQVGCTISPNRTVRVNEILTFSAFQNPANVPVSFVFDHGDGTRDATAQSRAYYAAPGFYQVRLDWASGGSSGTVLCGTVTVEVDVNPADYLGRTPESAQALATSRGLGSRIVRIDDMVFPVTADYRPDRLNFEVDANKVTKVTVG